MCPGWKARRETRRDGRSCCSAGEKKLPGRDSGSGSEARAVVLAGKRGRRVRQRRGERAGVLRGTVQLTRGGRLSAGGKRTWCGRMRPESGKGRSGKRAARTGPPGKERSGPGNVGPQRRKVGPRESWAAGLG